MADQLPLSPLAPPNFPELPHVRGVRLGTAATAMKYQGRDDLMLAEMPSGASVAGVFTKSKTASAPVDWCRKVLSGGEALGLLVNAGNANAFTGRAGVESVENCVEAVADLLSCRPSRIFVASTGVIGETLPHARIVQELAAIRQGISDSGPANWGDAAGAIMTTDTFPKGATRTAKIGDAEVTIVGIAKGSGMIAPDMATMLSFMFTDARLPADILQALLADTVDSSFNAITVDSDTSTSDTVLLFATGMASGQPEADGPGDHLLADFKAKLGEVAMDLAQQIVRDGEGASKFVSITVTGAEDAVAARNIGLSIGNSPLVKTAIAGEDANWGRIVMAVGKASERADRDRMAIAVGGVTIAEYGAAVDDYNETPVAEHMKGADIDIQVDVGVGNGAATVWTCDLTHGYISINADYRS